MQRKPKRKTKVTKATKIQKAPGSLRASLRDINTKFIPPLKALTIKIYTLGPVTPDFTGFKVPAGEVVDKLGRKWQIQAHVICSKKHMLKRDEVVPMVRKWAIGLKLRVLAKYIIDWANK